MLLTPLIAVHMSAAIGAIVTGPVALWARKATQQRPRLHRAFGYAWVTLMLVASLSAIFIHVSKYPSFAGFTPVHLLIPVVLGMLVLSFRYLVLGNIAMHRRLMQYLYLGACVVAGLFTLAPDRLIGHAVWSQLGLL